MKAVREIQAEVHVASYVEADPKLVKKVMEAPVNDDGRSEFLWFRLANGDLILGVFPVGNTYEEVSQQIEV